MGARNKYYDYINGSEKWVEIKNKLFAERGKVCERCRSTERIQVHHLHYDNLFNEQLEDLMVLCVNCHRKEHGLRPARKRKKKTHVARVMAFMYSIGIPQHMHRKACVRALKIIVGVNIKPRTKWGYIANKCLIYWDEFEPLVKEKWQAHNSKPRKKNK